MSEERENFGGMQIKKTARKDCEKSSESSNESLDPNVERVRRRLVRLMIISTSITILLVGGVLFTVLYEIPGYRWRIKAGASDIEVNPRFIRKEEIKNLLEKMVQKEVKKLIEQIYSTNKSQPQEETVFNQKKVLLSIDPYDKLVSTIVKGNVLYLEFQSEENSEARHQRIRTKIIVYDIKGKNVIELIPSGEP